MNNQNTTDKDTSTPKIMVVEDNALNLRLYTDILEVHGFEVVATSSGKQVLSLARSEMPDVIVMDIQLPEVSGLEVTQWLKTDEELSQIPVIAVTAFAMKGDEERMISGGCQAYLSKPIQIDSFLEVINRFIK